MPRGRSVAPGAAGRVLRALWRGWRMLGASLWRQVIDPNQLAIVGFGIVRALVLSGGVWMSIQDWIMEIPEPGCTKVIAGVIMIIVGAVCCYFTAVMWALSRV